VIRQDARGPIESLTVPLIESPTMLTSAAATTSGNAAEGDVSTVLVVDDEPTARLALAARLKRLGYRVIQAGDGKAGLEALRRERPSLTILD
jgi:CheY-like chemotaxis protein